MFKCISLDPKSRRSSFIGGIYLGTLHDTSPVTAHPRSRLISTEITLGICQLPSFITLLGNLHVDDALGLLQRKDIRDRTHILIHIISTLMIVSLQRNYLYFKF